MSTPEGWACRFQKWYAPQSHKEDWLLEGNRADRFQILISIFWPLGEGFQGFRPQIQPQHAKISMLTSFEVIWLQLP